MVIELNYSDFKSVVNLTRLAPLTRISRGKPLFPHLRTLTLSRWPITFSEASLLFSYGLHAFIAVFSFPDPRGSLPGSRGKLSEYQQRQLCIHLLVKRCRELQVFRVPVSYRDQPKFRRELYPVVSLDSLRTLSIHCSDIVGGSESRPICLEKISKMKHLRFLRLDMARFHQDIISPIVLGDFPSLRSLDISAPFTSMPLVFRSLCCGVLTSITIRMDYLIPEWADVTPHGIQDCIETLISRTRESLIKFRFWALKSSGLTTLLSMLMFQPLTRAHRLRTCDIRLHGKCMMTDEYSIATFAQSWPDLQNLRIHHPGDPSLGVQALVELASRCPSLDEVMLKVSFNYIPPLEEIPTLNHKLTRLLFIDLGSDDVHHLDRIAMLVHQLFPRLDPCLVDTWGEIRGPGWLKVMKRVKILQEADSGNSNKDPQKSSCIS